MKERKRKNLQEPVVGENLSVGVESEKVPFLWNVRGVRFRRHESCGFVVLVN